MRLISLDKEEINYRSLYGKLFFGIINQFSEIEDAIQNSFFKSLKHRNKIIFQTIRKLVLVHREKSKRQHEKINANDVLSLAYGKLLRLMI